MLQKTFHTCVIVRTSRFTHTSFNPVLCKHLLISAARILTSPITVKYQPFRNSASCDCVSQCLFYQFRVYFLTDSVLSFPLNILPYRISPFHMHMVSQTSITFPPHSNSRGVGLRSASVGAEQTSTGRFAPLSESPTSFPRYKFDDPKDKKIVSQDFIL